MSKAAQVGAKKAAKLLPAGVRSEAGARIRRMEFEREITKLRAAREREARIRADRESDSRVESDQEHLRRGSVIVDALKAPLWDNTVLYEAYHATTVGCNPEAIFRGILADPRFEGFTHIWALKDPSGDSSFEREFASNARVRVVSYRSEEYFTALHRAKYLVNNSTFPSEFTKRDNQVYLNTWHGTPLKKMLYDTPAGPRSAGNVVRNALAADYLLSPNRYTTETMYSNAFRLEGIYDGAILELGYPRVDVSLREGAADRARARLESAGLEVQGKRIVLYAPTWKGDDLSNPEDDLEDLAEIVRMASEGLADSGPVVVLLRLHQFVYGRAATDERLSGFLVPLEIGTNELLAATDILVTDYSSIFFDFLPLDRPICFFAKDLTEYTQRRGLYLPKEKWPGPLSETPAKLIDDVRAALTGDQRRTTRREWRKRFASKEDGGATARVIDQVFAGVVGETDLEERRTSVKKRRILLYPGGMSANGITSSAVALLNAINYSEYDVTVYVGPGGDPNMIGRIDPRCRVLHRVGRQVQTPREAQARAAFIQDGPTSSRRVRNTFLELFAREARRCFGDARFDAVVDFSGYSPFFAALLRSVPARRHAIWQHNDLDADSRRFVDGEWPHLRNLRATFALYDGFDALVSVSERLMRRNRKRLERYAPRGKFRYVENLLPVKQIEAQVRGAGLNLRGGMRELVLGPQLEISDIASGLDLAELRTAIDQYSADRSAFPAADRRPTFLFAGRLSPEKALSRLIRAMSILEVEGRSARLVIVGDGPQRHKLEKLVRRLGLQRGVVFAGYQPDAVRLMAKADCFVMSSRYEGQPMVLLEAQLLGLPIVTTRFYTVDGALYGGNGLVTDPTPEALAEGLRAFLDGQVSASVFDYAAYAATAMEHLEAVLRGDPANQNRDDACADLSASATAPSAALPAP
ncbi:glycosyltransferase [Luteimicrobium xylanilyticum]|uniref:glycosyltransferase n=1 Tax=Luteimicrobium xylanilyticum TaxID=1133546 RepID=UPI001883CA5B|nr:glycosyltransferase [Luteimicrobium xylanilyticum]